MVMQFIDLAAQQAQIRDKIYSRIKKVLDEGKYIMGPEVKEFENELSKFCGAKYSFGVANGTDAIQIALLALGAKAGDAVFCPTFTFAATAEVVPHVGATPFFVDVREDTFNLDVDSLKQAIVDAREMGLNPAGVIPVDLFGLSADYTAIEAVARENDMWIVSDSAQGFGATHHGRTTGSIGDIATTSFFPAKPLGCYGDGGAVFTSNDELAVIIESLRVHGKGSHKYDNERVGVNSRLDTIQAAILLEKIDIYPQELEKRQVVADAYSEYLLSSPYDVPFIPEGHSSVWAQYTLKADDESARDEAMDKLKAEGIPSVVYYPLPLHQQTAYSVYPRVSSGLETSESLSKRVFSLPMHPYLEMDSVKKISEILIG